jgi:CRISPR-associated protein Csm2
MPDPRSRNPQHDRRAEAAPTLDLSGVHFAEPLDPELFSSIAQRMAQTIAAANRNANKSTQLRRFFDELILWDTRVAQQPDKFAEYLPFIRMLNAKAAYAQGRGLVDTQFVQLFRHTLNEVKDVKTLSTCKLFWEAFMGFYKQERQD